MTTYSHTFHFTLTEVFLIGVCLFLILWHAINAAHAMGSVSGLKKGHAMALEFYTTALALMTQETAAEEEIAETEAPTGESETPAA